VIYETNLFTAYQAGRHAQMTDPDVLKARPYWQYRHGDSMYPRPEHLAWDGLVLRADDPWWQAHYPPCGWGCKCTAFALSDEDLQMLGKKGPDTAPPMQPYEWTDKKTGQVYAVADKGIDPGWDYNVGEAANGRTQALRIMDDTGPWKDLGGFGPDQYGRPDRIPVEATSTMLGSKAATVQELRQALRAAIGGDTTHLTDPTGAVTETGHAIVDHILKDPAKRWNGREQYFTLIPELITDPYEIWVTFARSELSGRVALRRKYVKAIRIKGSRSVGLVAEAQGGYWVGLTFFHGDLRYATSLRKGHMIYGKN